MPETEATPERSPGEGAAPRSASGLPRTAGEPAAASNAGDAHGSAGWLSAAAESPVLVQAILLLTYVVSIAGRIGDAPILALGIGVLGAWWTRHRLTHATPASGHDEVATYRIWGIWWAAAIGYAAVIAGWRLLWPFIPG